MGGLSFPATPRTLSRTTTLEGPRYGATVVTDRGAVRVPMVRGDVMSWWAATALGLSIAPNGTPYPTIQDQCPTDRDWLGLGPREVAALSS